MKPGQIQPEPRLTRPVTPLFSSPQVTQTNYGFIKKEQEQNGPPPGPIERAPVPVD
ncbi:hypothetical protein ABG768_026939, partial [Culter alburnus]